jgi:hypothetical protein
LIIIIRWIIIGIEMIVVLIRMIWL